MLYLHLHRAVSSGARVTSNVSGFPRLELSNIAQYAGEKYAQGGISMNSRPVGK